MRARRKGGGKHTQQNRIRAQHAKAHVYDTHGISFAREGDQNTQSQKTDGMGGVERRLLRRITGRSCKPRRPLLGPAGAPRGYSRGPPCTGDGASRSTAAALGTAAASAPSATGAPTAAAPVALAPPASTAYRWAGPPCFPASAARRRARTSTSARTKIMKAPPKPTTRPTMSLTSAVRRAAAVSGVGVLPSSDCWSVICCTMSGMAADLAAILAARASPE